MKMTAADNLMKKIMNPAFVCCGIATCVALLYVHGYIQQRVVVIKLQEKHFNGKISYTCFLNDTLRY